MYFKLHACSNKIVGIPILIPNYTPFLVTFVTRFNFCDPAIGIATAPRLLFRGVRTAARESIPALATENFYGYIKRIVRNGLKFPWHCNETRPIVIVAA